MEVKIEVRDMPKLESPFVREEIDGKYVVTKNITPGYAWVFEDDSVLAVEKIHGTNCSVTIENGKITSIWNRKEHIPFFNKNKIHLTQAILNSYEKGYLGLPDGQHFGEAIGPKINGNPYKLDKHLWLPFNTYCKNHLAYKSWGKYPKDFETISNWFRKDLMPLYSYRVNGREWKGKHFVEGVVFYHPDGRMSKLRRDMFDWWYIDNSGAKGHNR